jgi:hypothetical protein
MHIKILMVCIILHFILEKIAIAHHTNCSLLRQHVNILIISMRNIFGDFGVAGAVLIVTDIFCKVKE